MYARVLKSMGQVLLLSLVAIVPLGLFAQNAKAPQAQASADSASRWDIFVGYSFLNPHMIHGYVNTLQPGIPDLRPGGPALLRAFSPNAPGPFLPGSTVPVAFDSIKWGGTVSLTRYFNRYVGLQADTGFHPKKDDNNDAFYTVSGGLIARLPGHTITPFIHGLVGGDRSEGPDFQPYKWGIVLTGGTGLDINTPLLNHHLAIRLVQADVQYTHIDHGTGVYGGRANPDMLRISSGLVYHLGTIQPPPPVTLACSASPADVFQGDVVTITGTAGYLNPKRTAVYTWTGNGVKGNGATATVDTAALAPGAYTVQGSVQEGRKAGQSAICSANFRVKAYDPPTITCSSNPGTIRPGETSTITAVGVSPQNRPLQYSYSAPAGSVSGSGTTATFTASTGTPIDTVQITCNVADDKGHLVSANTGVTVTAPYVPAAPKVSELCSISFDKDKLRPTRVDNEAKACLDDVALSLQKQSDAKVYIVGQQTSKEKSLAQGHGKHAKKGVDVSAQRAVNTKEYLVKEKGIEPSRVIVLSGSTDSSKVDNYLVPAGATFDASATAPVSEEGVKPQVRKPLAGHKHVAKSK